MIGPVSTENSFQARQMPISTIFCASSFLPLATSTETSGAPICACRDSSVWMLEIRLEKVQSPASAASAANPRNCMLVKPVSKAKVSISAVPTALRVVIMPSNMCRAAMTAHSLVP
ncbi:hypothetical protein D3C86_1860670 [compost metagenome]